jgi:hypothetical protein
LGILKGKLKFDEGASSHLDVCAGFRTPFHTLIFGLFWRFFGSTGVGIQGFPFARQEFYHLSHALSPFLF